MPRNRRETQEQRLIRLNQERERSRLRVLNETPIQREARLLRAREYQRRRRANESLTERDNRLQQNQTNYFQTIANESLSERQSRLQQNQTYQSIRRANETINQRQTRLEQDQIYQSNRRSNESEEQHNNGLMGNRMRQQIWRQNQRNRNQQNVVFSEMSLSRTHRNARKNKIPVYSSIGDLTTQCEYCSALKFNSETTNACCLKGKIQIPALPSPPPLLLALYNGEHPQSNHFLQHIRQYNTSLSFAALCCNQNRLAGRGPPIFRIQGGVYHSASTVIPINPQEAGFAQLFILDSFSATNLRHRRQPSLNPELLVGLHEMLTLVNPYVSLWRNMHSMCQQYEEQFHGFQDSISVQIVIGQNLQGHSGRYSLPNAHEIAAVFNDNVSSSSFTRDVVVYSRLVPGQSQVIPSISPLLDPLLYPMLFPFGTCGWHPDLQSLHHRQTEISLAKYCVYQLAQRPNSFNIIIKGRILLHVYLVDLWTRIEAHRLKYIRHNQSKLRVEQYNGLRDYLANRNECQIYAGRICILPSTFIGSPRYLQQRLQDAIALIVRFGFPDLFITFTCNSNWVEIQNNLLPGQTAADRPDLVCRVFYIKLKALIKEIEEKQIFGKVLVITGVVEFQKRGLPHAHILVILHPDDKYDHNVNEIDKTISAELPSPVDDPEYFNLVTSHMMHGPCGASNPSSPCMQEKNGVLKCKKYYPKDFQEETLFRNGQYPLYRRRDLGRTTEVRGITLDSRSVVPHNHYLLHRFKAHINIEICSSFTCIKYLYKYIYKGADRAQIEIINHRYNNEDTYDEVSKYLDVRYVSAHEAVHRIYGYDLTFSNFSVELMQLHLPGHQMVRFEVGREEAAMVNMSSSMLLAFFKLNQECFDARSYLYHEIVEHFLWDKELHVWRRRKNKIKIIGRLPFVPPRLSDLFYLRLLLLNCHGPQSFEDLSTVNGVYYSTFRAAAQNLGLLEEDNEWEHAIIEAIEFQMPRQLRELFACILVYCSPNDPVSLWNKYVQFFCDDLQNSPNPEELALGLVSRRVTYLGRSITEFGFNLPASMLQAQENFESLPTQETTPLSPPNPEQEHIISKIEAAVQQQVGRLFFMDGPGGTGKTFVYSHLIQRFKNQGLKVIVVASTGIAATLLPGGSTAHSKFKLPLGTTESSLSSISFQSDAAQVLRDASLIIWDEAVMQHRFVFETVDRLFQDVMQCELPFGGKVILLGGDFRQILPVVKKGNRATTIQGTIKASPLWPHFQVLRLTQNMRVNASEVDFCNFLLQVGNGQANQPLSDSFIVPESLKLKENEDIVTEIFGTISDAMTDLSRRTILCALNTEMMKINEQVLERLPGETFEYYSIDKSAENEVTGFNVFPSEFLNTLLPSGLPPHKLSLKIGAIVMLLRNLNVSNGLCNGTRLRIVELRQHVVVAIPLLGPMANQVVFIPRIELQPPENDAGIIFTRRQFPLRLSFAMTINKSQGQTFDKVGIVLQEPVFTHGQLYVALSRCKTSSGIKVVLPAGQIQTKNIVYTEIL